jgi:hypothetical protein
MGRLDRITRNSRVADFRFALSAVSGGKSAVLLPAKLDYLGVRYRNEETQRAAFDCLKQALSWYWRHRRSLETEGLLVIGQTGEVVPEALLAVMYDIFATVPLSFHIALEIPFSLVAGLAKAAQSSPPTPEAAEA